MLLVAASVAVGAPSALAFHTPRTTSTLPGSQFQGGDGDQNNAPPLIDWQGLQADGRVGHTSDYNPSDDAFSGGSKEDDPDGWGITHSNNGVSPASDNILDLYSAVDRAPGGDVFVYLAFTRNAATNGTTYLAFDLNQDGRLWRNSDGAMIPCRKTGDILIAYVTAGGESSVQVQRWVTDSADPSTGCARSGHVVSAGNLTGDVVQAAVNTGTITNYLPSDLGSTIPTRQFGEAAINLTRALADLHEPCAEFVSTWMHSRASNVLTLNSLRSSQLKDYVAPQRLPVAICKRDPDLSTTASGSVSGGAHHRQARRPRALGGEIWDTAHLSGGLFPTGTLTFDLYGPNDAGCSGQPVFTFVSTVRDNGDYQSGAFSPTRAGTYRWVAHYSGDVNNEPKSTSCDDPAETVVVSPASPSLSSTASGPVHLERARSGPAHQPKTAREHVATRAAQPINDIAHLSDGFSPTGTITFSLYGPDSPTCSGDPLSTSSVTVHGNGDYNSDPFTPTRAGTYRWVVHYSGDDNNDSAGPTHCGIESETVVIEPARPTIFTVATPGAVHVDNPIADVASLDGGADPHGTITFHLYGPNDAGCTGTPAHTSTVDVHGNGSYTSSSFTPTQLGTYHWVAHYSGDDNNEQASNPCNDEREVVVVSPPPLHPTALTTTASPVAPATSPAGSLIHDTAHLTGGVDPTGRITFKLYGPNDPNCTGPSAEIAPVTVAGNGNYTASFTPVRVGEYRWRATYSGDTHNLGSGPTACQDAAERVVVSPAHPALTTRASLSASVGLGVHDTAFLTGGSLPTGTITFRLYGPNNAACSRAAVFTTTQKVIGNRAYRSSTFIPRQAGTYRWVARYSGDDNNAAASTTCGESHETVVVPRRLLLLTTSASPPADVHPTAHGSRGGGREIHDVASLRLWFAPTGRITFALFGPDNTTCSGAPIFTSSTAVNGNGVYNSNEFTVTKSGVYRWVAFYSGDTNNHPVLTSCRARNEQVSVPIPAVTVLTSSASAPADAGGAIHDTAHLSGGASPTGRITFRLYGSDDTNCSGAAVFTSTVSVSGNGDYDSGSFTPPAPGAYRWVVDYSGDHANDPAGPTLCGDSAELGIVRPPHITPVSPGLSTSASQYPSSGETLYDIAHLSGGVDPGGAITFMLYGPDDQSCSGPPAFTSVVNVNGNGDYPSAAFTVPHPGTYRWVASYSGDAVNTAVGPTACGEVTETSSVSAAPEPTPDPGPNAPSVPHQPKPPPSAKPKPKPTPKPPSAKPKPKPKPKPPPPKPKPKPKPKPPLPLPKPHPVHKPPRVTG